MVPMYLGKADVNTYDKGAGREFLVSNGRGSYGFSTVIGANTRREHRLLVVRRRKTQHSVLVSKIEETIFHERKVPAYKPIQDLVYPDVVQTFRNSKVTHFKHVRKYTVSSSKKSIFMPQGKACFTIVSTNYPNALDKIPLTFTTLFYMRSNSEIAEPRKRVTCERKLRTIGSRAAGHSYFKATSGT